MASSKAPSFLLELAEGETAKLLSLDGGGIKGISSLVILEAIMEKVKAEEKRTQVNNSDDERLPKDYFHLAAGTSTGGLIALMLFRFGMSASEARDAYDRLAPEVFQPGLVEWAVTKLPGGCWVMDKLGQAKTLLGFDKFSDKPLREAIRKIIQQYGRDEDKRELAAGYEPLLVNEHSGMMFMCATVLRNRGESTLLRSYPTPSGAEPLSREKLPRNRDKTFDQISITDAIRATSAAPTYLPEVSYDGVVFWDGGLLNNNPINQLWRARFDLVEGRTAPAPLVSCVISLGCGWSDAKSQSIFRFRNTVATAASFITNTEAKNTDFQRYINRIDGRTGYGNITYERFNTPTQNVSIDLDDYDKMKQLKDITKTWLEDPEEANKG